MFTACKNVVKLDKPFFRKEYRTYSERALPKLSGPRQGVCTRTGQRFSFFCGCGLCAEPTTSLIPSILAGRLLDDPSARASGRAAEAMTFSRLLNDMRGVPLARAAYLQMMICVRGA